MRAVASAESQASGRAIQASTSASSASIRWASGLWAERTSRTTVSGGTFGTCGRYPYRRPSFITRSPRSSCVSPAIRRKSVLFPAPFGPTRATFSPAWIVKSACSRTIVDPHAFRRSRPAMIGSMSQVSFLRSEIRLRFLRSLIAGGEPVVGENPRFRRCSLRDGGGHRGHDVPALEGPDDRIAAGAPRPVVRRDVRAQDRVEAVLVRFQFPATESRHVSREEVAHPRHGGARPDKAFQERFELPELPPSCFIRPALAGLVLQGLPEAEQGDRRGVWVGLEELTGQFLRFHATIVAEPCLLQILDEVPDPFSSIATEV